MSLVETVKQEKPLISATLKTVISPICFIKSLEKIIFYKKQKSLHSALCRRFLMKTDKNIAGLPSESLKIPEFYVNPDNPTTNIKKRENKTM